MWWFCPETAKHEIILVVKLVCCIKILNVERGNRFVYIADISRFEYIGDLYISEFVTHSDSMMFTSTNQAPCTFIDGIDLIILWSSWALNTMCDVENVNFNWKPIVSQCAERNLKQSNRFNEYGKWVLTRSLIGFWYWRHLSGDTTGVAAPPLVVTPGNKFAIFGSSHHISWPTERLENTVSQ